jgi:zinc transport system substrate-binding protein
MMKSLPLALISGAAALLFAGPASAMEGVVASIKPIHSLVAGVMGEVGSPDLLVPGNASPHAYTLRPSDARKLEQAKVVFWVGEDLEMFLEKPLQSLSSGARIVSLSNAPGLELLDLREGGGFEAHSHGHDHDHDHDHHHLAKDMHFWLDPENARVIVTEIARTLSETDPSNASIYERNAAELDQRLQNLVSETSEKLQDVRETPFIVFHDGYHYFEHRFDMHATGSISVNPETPPSAHRVKEIQDTISSTNAACVFSEPQFEPRIVSIVTEGTGAQVGELDPLGASLEDGPDLYFELIQNLASSLKDCLARS